jgi:AmiR/NasT family two-component response regulator
LLALDATQLQAVLENRVVIQQAKAMLAQRLGVTLEEGSAFLRTAARAQGMKLDELATEIVESIKTRAEH